MERSGSPKAENNSMVTIVLDMRPSNFEQIRTEFVNDLSELLDIESSSIEIIDVRDGCTEIDIKVPSDRADLLNFLKSNNKDLPEDIQQFLKKYSLIPDPICSQIIIRKNPRNSTTWLHLSDAHFESSDSGTKRNFWGQDKVRETFVRQLPDLLKESSLEPDLVFFTGDVTFGGRKEEYDVALSFIRELRKSLPKQNDTQMMFVPGNHDVNREVVNRFPREEEYAQSFLKSNDSIIQFLNSSKHEPDRERLFQRQNNFFDFSFQCRSYGQPELNHKYFFTTIVERKNVRIGIAGLNSAWRSSSDADRNNLIFGVPQLDQAVNDLRSADLKLMLTHHPPDSDWFSMPDMLYQRGHLHFFDFILRGHEHDPRSEVTTFSGNRQYCQISAGAMYSSELAKSFNAVHLDFDSGLSTIFFWRLSENTYKWIRDLEVDSRGYLTFPLPKLLRTRLRRRAISKSTDGRKSPK